MGKRINVNCKAHDQEKKKKKSRLHTCYLIIFEFFILF